LFLSMIVPYSRLEFDNFQQYLLSFEFKFISIRPTQTGYIQVMQLRPSQ